MKRKEEAFEIDLEYLEGILAELSNEQAGALFKEICSYAGGSRKRTELDRKTRYAFHKIREQAAGRGDHAKQKGNDT